MKKLMYFTMCMCTVLIALASCSSKADNELIGKWEQTIEQGSVKVVTTYDFQNGGKLTQTFVMKSDYPAIDIVGEGDCDYTYEDGVITFKFSAKDFNFSKFEMEGYSEDMIDTMMEQVKSTMVDVEQKFTDVKVEGDELTAMFQGMEVSLTRM